MASLCLCLATQNMSNSLLFILWWSGVDMDLDPLWWNIPWTHYLARTHFANFRYKILQYLRTNFENCSLALSFCALIFLYLFLFLSLILSFVRKRLLLILFYSLLDWFLYSCVMLIKIKYTFANQVKKPFRDPYLTQRFFFSSMKHIESPRSPILACFIITVQ